MSNDPFKRGGSCCDEDTCICFEKAEQKDDVIKLFSDRGSLCFQAPLVAPISGCLSTVTGGGQDLINAISTQFDEFKNQEDTIGVFAVGQATGAGTIEDPWEIVHPAGSDDQTAAEVSFTATNTVQPLSSASTVQELGDLANQCFADLKSAVDKFGPSTDAGNLITSGASDGLSYIDAAAINAVVTPHVPSVSGDAGNILTVGADGETFLDCAAVKGCETLTSVSYDAATTTLTYVDESGNSTVVNLAALAADIFVDGATFDASTGILTLTDNDTGTADVTVNLGALVSQVTNNNDGTYTHTSGDGSTTTIQVVSGDANNAITVGSDGGAFTRALQKWDGTNLDAATDKVLTDGTLTKPVRNDATCQIEWTDCSGQISLVEDIGDVWNGSFTAGQVIPYATHTTLISTTQAIAGGTSFLTYNDGTGAEDEGTLTIKADGYYEINANFKGFFRAVPIPVGDVTATTLTSVNVFWLDAVPGLIHGPNTLVYPNVVGSTPRTANLSTTGNLSQSMFIAAGTVVKFTQFPATAGPTNAAASYEADDCYFSIRRISGVNG